MKGKTRASLFTLGISIVNSVLSVVFSLVYNSYLIQIYGSKVNGLISTLTQFVSLFAIVEGGFTTAAVVATYSPLVNKDFQKLNDILYTTKRTYLKIGGIITILVTVFGSVYIRYIVSPLSYNATFSLLILTVLVTASSLCFLSKYTVLLQGDNKEYVQILLALIARASTWGLSIGMMLLKVNIIILYSINLLNVVFNIVLAFIYEHKHYPMVNYRGTYNKYYIKGTNDVLFQKVASTIFTSTDLVLISVFIDLSYASVYNVYYQVFKSVLTFLAAIAQAPFNSFGQLYREKDSQEKVNKYFSLYQKLVVVISGNVLTITGVLIIPFVRLYTRNILDFNYVYPSLALLFYSQIFTQIANRPFGTILNATGNFKMQNVQCGSAAVVNMIVSIAFIKKWHINSIVFGSFVGTLVILVANIYQAYKYVLHDEKNGHSVVLNILANYVVGLVVIGVSLKLDVIANSYINLIGYAIGVTILVSIILLLLNIIVDRNGTINLIKYIKSTIVAKL